MPPKSVRAFDFFWYGDNSKVNNNRARGIYDRVLGTQSRLNDAKNVALLDPRKIRKCYFHGMVVALGQREFKLLSDPGTAAAWLRAAT